eukprot:Gb_16276 [translate_table: standard]
MEWQYKDPTIHGDPTSIYGSMAKIVKEKAGNVDNVVMDHVQHTIGEKRKGVPSVFLCRFVKYFLVFCVV